MPNEFVARNGVIALNNSIVTGSLIVTGGITGSFSGSLIGDTTGTASYATQALTSSNANTASYILQAVSSSFATNASTSSYVLNAVSASYVSTASYILNAVSASYASTSSNVQGGTTNYIALWSGTTILSSSTIYQTGGNVGIGTATATPAARLQVSGTVNVANIKGSGSVATSSIFTVDGGAGRLFTVNDTLTGSLFSVNTISGLPVIEAFSDNTVRIGKYGIKGLFISQSYVGINKETNLNGYFDVSGSMYLTGSLFNSGSITTNGTVTAQTLIVQTITSSIDYITGSTRFGSLITNTHVFTGSVSMTGSLSVSGSTSYSTFIPTTITVTSTSTLTPDISIGDTFTITAQAAALSIANPSGTPINGQKMIIRIKDNGTARAITWSGTQYRASSDLALPTTTIINKTMYNGFIYNSSGSGTWDLLAYLNNF